MGMKILWLSRHKLTAEQVTDLGKIYGDVEVVEFNKPVKTWKEVIEIGKDCDILAVAVSPRIVADLVNPKNNTKPVICSKPIRVPTGKMFVNPATGFKEQEYMFKHGGWQRIIKLDLITEDL